MPSFDVVSEVDLHEVTNAVDQARREVSTRFDFRGSNARYALKDGVITLSGDAEFQLKQLLNILQTKLSRRGVDIACLELADAEPSGKEVHQQVTLRQGVDTPMAKKIVKLIKDKKFKVQAAIQGEKVRVTGKKRDDLQQVMAMLKQVELGVPLQYDNFRD